MNELMKLKGCPNCGGTLNDAGRCSFCGSKVYDFLNIDFDKNGGLTANTYIRIKCNNKIVMAPVVTESVQLNMSTDSLPIMSVDFMVTGSMYAIDEEELKDG